MNIDILKTESSNISNHSEKISSFEQNIFGNTMAKMKNKQTDLQKNKIQEILEQKLNIKIKIKDYLKSVKVKHDKSEFTK